MKKNCTDCKFETIDLTDPCMRNVNAEYMHIVLNLKGIPKLARSIEISELPDKITKCDKWEPR